MIYIISHMKQNIFIGYNLCNNEVTHLNKFLIIMTNYKDTLTKLEIIARKILAIDGKPAPVKLTHVCWNTKYTADGVVEIPWENHFKILIMGDEVDYATSIEELQEKLINILAQ